VLLKTLSDTSDEVVILTVQALARIASKCNNLCNYFKEITFHHKFSDAKSMASSSLADSYFNKFMKSLLRLFSHDRVMQEERWAFIIR